MSDVAAVQPGPQPDADLRQQADEVLDSLDDFVEQEGERFAPADEHAADLDRINRLGRAVRSHDRRRARLQAVADAEHRRTDAWLERETGGMDAERSRLLGMLESFARAWKRVHRHSPPKLPDVTLRLSKPRESIDLSDEEAFVDWAEGNERLDLVKHEPKPSKGEIAKVVSRGQMQREDEEAKYFSAVLSDGEVIPGVLVKVPKLDYFNATIKSFDVVENTETGD